ncbi:MAG: hypothetical protein EOO01_42925 [Chitinophagaceae bacterium]|nr:MAG: hypothetical protein EOO01_42925 [Chitinophagaceae bacterium]
MLSKITHDPASPEKVLRATRLIFVAIISGMILFMLVSLFINQSAGPLSLSLKEEGNWPAWIVGIISGAGFIWGRRLFQATLKTAKDSLKPLEEKLKDHRSALVRYLLIGDIILVLNSVFFLLVGDFIYQMYAAIIVGAMLAVTPLKRRLISQLELDASEQTKIT